MRTHDYQHLAEMGCSLIGCLSVREDTVVCDRFWTLDADNIGSHVKPVIHNREYEGEMLGLGYYPEGISLWGQKIAFSLDENGLELCNNLTLLSLHWNNGKLIAGF